MPSATSGKTTMSIELQILGSTYVIGSSPSMSCVICRTAERAFLFRQGETEVGICEPCSGLAGWAWRQLTGEVSPGFNKETANLVSRVYVLIARRKMIMKMDAPPDISEAERRIPAPAEIDSSYEFLLLEQPNGSLDLPSALVSNLSPVAAAMRALSDVELISWEPLLEPLYTAYSPRGRLVAVMLARGWGESPGHATAARQWRPWPLSSHTGDMSGFWRSLEPVWRLRLYKHCSVGEPGELCVLLRKAAREFIELQEAVQHDPSTDTTFRYALQACMSADEIVIARMIQSAAKRALDEKALVVRQPVFSGNRKSHSQSKTKAGKKSDWPELVITPETAQGADSDQSGMEEVDSGNDETDAGDVSEEDSAFARPPRSPQKE